MAAARIRNMNKLLKDNTNAHSVRMAIGAAQLGLKSVDPYLLVRNSIKIADSILNISDVNGHPTRFDLSLFGSIYVVGAGKATGGMLYGLKHVFGKRIREYAITIPYNVGTKGPASFITKASHPLPDKNGVKGTKKILAVIEKATPKDLVFVLISGGGSALMPLPIKGTTLQEKQEVTSGLLASGASINEINTVRKHLSGIKGGRLAMAMQTGTTLVSLILSDVVTDKVETIASGPTAPDRTTFNDAKLILQKYKLWNNEKVISKSIRKVIDNGLQKRIADTPKPTDPVFRNVHNILIGNNSIACAAISRYLDNHGIKAMNLGSSFTGCPLNLGDFLFKMVDDFLPESVSYAFVLGGETTVELGNGMVGIGGRNQEAVLAAASKFKSWNEKDFTIICLGTDGIDGNSKAAGALITPRILSKIAKKKIEVCKYLRKHDSNTFFKKINSTVITDATGTNVNDISIVCRIK
jgi:glycerate 2-kinase